MSETSSPASWTAVGRTLHAGEASGVALVLDQPLSMWGGLDPHTGTIIDQRHPQVGQVAAGRILVMTSGRGSSSSSTVLAEALRAGTAPSAMVLAEPDGILVLGALVAQLIDGLVMPIVQLDPESYAAIATGDRVQVAADGVVRVDKSAA